jgi:hypothetical protein
MQNMIDTSAEKTVNVYQYESKRIRSFYRSAIFLAIVLLFSLIQLWRAPDNKILQKMVIWIPCLLVVDVLTLSEPTKITDDGECLTFYAFNRKHVYKWKDMSPFKVKRFRMTDRILLQIGNKPLSGRYWISTNALSNGPELLQKLVAHENKLKKLVTRESKLKKDKQVLLNK